MVFHIFDRVSDSTGGRATFERVGDSTGGVKDQKGLCLACLKAQVTALVDVPTATRRGCGFFLLDSLMSSLSSHRRDTEMMK